MVINEGVRQLARKQDFVHIVIFLIIALSIGVYLIFTTTLIARDSVSYIHYAKALSHNPFKTIRDCSDYAHYTPGYPFLIFLTHRFVNLFGSFSSVSSWIYSAQAVTLFCRLLALISLYFIGKELVGSNLSFWAIIILTILPYPAQLGSDALRDWPHMLFLAAGFLLLLQAAIQKRWWLFGLVGVVAGLGYLIRPMCAQLLVYGVFWLIFNLFKREHKYSLSRTKVVCGLALLVMGFAVVAAPYMKIRGEILPTRLQQIIESFSSCPIRSEIQEQSSGNYMAELVPSDIAKALWKLIDEISANLMYFFVPFLFIGIYHLLCKDVYELPVRFLITAFILLNVVMVILRYVCVGSTLSNRYVLPLTAFTIFFVPIGLQMSGEWIDKLLCKTVCKNDRSEEGSRRWFFLLLIIGAAICTPKLFKPIRNEKKSYLTAIEWLKKNTPEDSIIAAPDSRICFYAERKILSVRGRLMSPDVTYTVKIHKKNFPPMISSDFPIVKIFKINKETDLVIYKMAFKTN